jgi:hypothetical protein
MSLDAKAGSFALNGTTGNQAITGVGFQPKVVLFLWNRLLADGTDVEGAINFGVGISSSARRAAGFRSTDNSASSANAAWNRNNSCIFINGLIVVDFVSQDSDGFTINVTTNTPANAIIVNYLALGGTDLTDVAVGTIAAKTTTGNEPYTGVGFQPTALMLFAGKWSTDQLDTSTNGAFTFGFATSSAARGAVGERSRNGSNPQVSRHRQSTSKVAVSLTDAGVFTEADLVSFDSDGFTLNYTTAGGTADIIYYLALRGPQVKVGALDQPTSTGNQTTSGIGFTPKALILASANDTSANNDATNNNGQVSIGWGTSSSARGSMWAGDLTAVSPTQTDKDLDRTKIIKMLSPGTTTLNAAADLDSFAGDQFVLNWTTVDATARQVLYFALGEAGGPVLITNFSKRPLRPAIFRPGLAR